VSMSRNHPVATRRSGIERGFKPENSGRPELWANMLIFKNTASKSGHIFQIDRKKQEWTLERQWLQRDGSGHNPQ